MTAHLEGADLLFHVFVVQVGVGASGLRVELEADMDMGHLGLQLVGLDAAILVEQSLSEGIEGDAAVHGASVDIDIAHFTGEILGHGALSAR